MEFAKSGGAQKRILLLDRDRVSFDTVKNTLSRGDYRIERAIDGEGFEAVENNPPDLIIADMEYTPLSGAELLTRIRQAGLAIPVIITGGEPRDAVTAFRLGAADFLEKPLDSAELEMRLPTALAAPVDFRDDGDEKYAGVVAQIEREKKEMHDLLRISASLNISSDSKDILKRLTDLAAESMHCEAASIMLVNSREKVLEFVVATGDKGQRLETLSVPLGEGIAGWVAVHGQPLIVNDTRKDPRFTGKVDKESGFVTRQILAVPMYLDSEIIGVLEVINTRDRRVLGENDLRLLNGIGERAGAVISTVRKIEMQQNFYIQTTNIIVQAIERKDIFSNGHSWKVAELCHKVASAMNLSDTERNDLHFGALLHDIGKLDMPSLLFNKRTLSDREREILRQHPVRGAKLLEPITLWKNIVPGVLFHHEAWDGSGYPFGRSGDSIPFNARIINLAEAFSVMRAANTYKRQLSLKEAVLEVMRSSGRQFDPEIVKVFVSVLERETPSQ
jgi:putative nucleotidyltransferase with HDIG domain